MINWFLELFTLEHLLIFVCGGLGSGVWQIVKARFQRRIVIIKWQYVMIPFVLGAIAYTSVQTQDNADCVREFQRTLAVRAQITTENDEVSRAQRELVYAWMHGLIFPDDPAIAQLEPTDPRREQHAIELTIRTDREFVRLINQQREYERQRAVNPLPPATCGLGVNDD
jgi:hypothetical protein